MEYIILIITVIGIHLFAWFTPGPLFILILRNSLAYGRKTWIWTGVGIMTGNFIHTTYSATTLFFLSWLSESFFEVIKYIWVAYLVYLAIKTFRVHSKKNIKKETSISWEFDELSPKEAFRIGFLTNILSPKASIFFVSIFTLVISAGLPVWWVIFLLIALPLNSLIMSIILSSIFSHKKIRSFYQKYQIITNRVLGSSLLFFAVLIVMH